jgi:ABC-type antimicrobial peptide transport system permease subunit
VVRATARQETIKAELQQAVRKIDPELAVNEIQSMDDRISDSLIDRRAPALLGGIFSGIALVLITVGAYGVLSYSVAQRQREIAIRMALGARPARIRRQFFSLALRLLAGGIVIGLCGAWAIGRVIQTVLFHVAAHSPTILAISTGLVAMVALTACLLPARRAARISPLKALADQ